jgi:hypothetical protein
MNALFRLKQVAQSKDESWEQTSERVRLTASPVLIGLVAGQFALRFGYRLQLLNVRAEAEGATAGVTAS